MYLQIITIPLITLIGLSLLGEKVGRKGLKVIVIIVNIIVVLFGLLILKEMLRNNTIIKINILDYLVTEQIKIKWVMLYDIKSVIMSNIVLIISGVVQIYSLWYMESEKHKIRFAIKLQGFTIMMTLFVLSNNFLMMFVGWEGIGIFSYFLINFYNARIEANKAAIKAMNYNRLGDISYLIIIIIIINKYQNNDIDILNLFVDDNLSFLICCFILASITKSAQILLQPWLASSMEGPTPVSALLHAATMVTAGVYLLMRISPILTQGPIEVLTIISLFTIIVCGLIGFFQSDIKKIIAYSTSAQLGYMFLILSLNYDNMANFHLLTHAFFKALLFLLAGIIIHSLLDNQDIRKLGSLLFKLPLAYLYFFIASYSIASLPYLSGYYSKELIIENTYLNISNYSFSCVGAMITVLYSIKLLKEMFYSNIKVNKNIYNNIHETPFYVYIVLFVLVLGSIFVGYLAKDKYIGLGVNNTSFDVENLPLIIKLIPLLLTIFSMVLYTFISQVTLQKGTQYFGGQLYIDSFVNTIVTKVTSFGYKTLYKNIERGTLETLVLNFYRFFFNLSNLPINPDSRFPISSRDSLVVYFYISFISLIFLYLFISITL